MRQPKRDAGGGWETNNHQIGALICPLQKLFTPWTSTFFTLSIWYNYPHFVTFYLTYLMSSLASSGTLHKTVFNCIYNKSHTILHGPLHQLAPQGPLPQLCCSLGLAAALQNLSSIVILFWLRSMQITVRLCIPRRQFGIRYKEQILLIIWQVKYGF